MPPRDANPRPNQPCPCGSGKPYKHCCALKKQRRRKLVRQSRKALTWIAAAAVLALVVYAFFQMSGIRYTDEDITVVDFSTLNRSQKRAALQAANQARCPCGCGMTLAQCVVTDSTCPLRTKNIDRIRAMVRENSQAQGGD